MIYFVTSQLQIFDDYGIESQTSLSHMLERFKYTEILGVDTETTGFSCWLDKVLSLQIGDGVDQYVIDVQSIDIKILKEFLESKTLIFQNAKFDLRFLFRFGIYPRKIRDTYLQEEVLNMGREGIRKSLDALAQRYLKISLSKEIRGKIHKVGLTPEVIKYGADDVKYLLQIDNKQRKRLIDENLLLPAKIENHFVVVLAYIEYCGIYLDSNKWSAKMEQDEKNLQNSIKILNDWVLDNVKSSRWIEPQLDLFSNDRKVRINWNSSKQVIELFKELGIDTVTQDEKTGELTHSVEASILQSQNHPIIKPYLAYKGYAKIVSTYGINFINQINPITGRIHTSFRQLMDTGRLSSGDKKTGGINLQNIPSDPGTRGCFTHQNKDSTLINCDYSGQENIVLVNESKDRGLLSFYSSGESDMHSFIASKIFSELKELSLSEIKKQFPDKRQIAKSAGFAIAYGGNGLTIASNLGISVKDGDEVYNSYFKAFPGLKDWFAATQAQTLSDGYVLINKVTYRKSYLPFFEEFKKLDTIVNNPIFWGRYREHRSLNSIKFLEYYKPTVRKYFKLKGIAERRSQNYRIQGTSAEITKIAGIKFMDWIFDNNLFGKVLIPNIVHDEYLLECPVSISEKTANALKDCMERAGDIYCKLVPLKAEPCITPIWKH